VNPAPLVSPRLRGFFAGAVGRPVGTAVLFATLLVVGAIAYIRIPIQLFPSAFSEPRLNLWILNPGANARENEERIARPIEEQLRTLSGIQEIESYSEDGFTSFQIQFQADLDMDLARAEVRDRVERAWPSLPSTAENAGMWSESADSLPITFFGVSVRGDPDRRDWLMDKVVTPRLEAVHGIGKVDVWGVLEDSMRILLDEDRVVAAGLDIGEVVRRLSSDNFVLPLGEVRDGGREVLLRSDMRFRSPAQIEDFPIGDGLRIRDVGRVARVKSVDNMVTLIDGDHAYWGMATKDSQANVVETSHGLKHAVEELERDPATGGDVSVTLFFVQGDYIESALAQLKNTAISGGWLAILVLFVFLRRLRLTLCVALSIPVSVLFAVAWEYFTGGTFNVLTMTGITLGIGMLVDNAIVVVENIVRIHQAGEPPLRAAAVGARQIALAITLATLTSVVVFLPLIFMTENKMLRVAFGGIGIPLSTSLLASLLVAVFFLPVIVGRQLGERPKRIGDTGRFFAPLLRVPVRTLGWCLGGMRFAIHALARLLWRAERAALAVLVPVRWILVAASGAAALWVARGLFAARRSTDSLAGFGVSFGTSPAQVSTMLGIASLSALVLAAFALPRWRRRPAGSPTRPESYVPKGDSLVQMVIDGNQRLLAWTLEHRVLATLAACLAFGSILVPLTQMKIAAFGQDEVDDDANFRVAFEADFTLDQAEEQVRVYGKRIEGWREEFGFEHWTCRFDEKEAYFSMYFAGRRPEEEVDAVERRLERELPRLPGQRLVFYDQNQSRGRSTSVARFALVGPDSRELERIGERAQEILERVPGLSQVTSPLSEAPPLIEVRVDRDVAHDLGITSAAIQNTVAWSLGGWALPRYQEEGREIPLVIELDETQSAGLPTLRDLAVWSNAAAVPLSSFADLSFARGARSIYRHDGQTSFTLEAKVDDPLQILVVTERAQRELDALELPRGFSWDRSDSALERTQEEFSELGRAFALSVVLVFLLMAILFESVMLPFAVLFTVPFAALGALWTLYLLGNPMDSFGWIGLIILAGVVVNNGIVLIDRIHELRAAMDRSRAVLEGSAHRVRPVLMTALTTVVGLAPMMVTEAPADSMIDYRALATIVGGGLTLSTIFTLWVVPLAYTLLDDLRGYAGRCSRRFLGISASPARRAAAGDLADPA